MDEPVAYSLCDPNNPVYDAGGNVAADLGYPIYGVVGIPVVFVLGIAGSLVPPLVSRFFPGYDILSKSYFRFFAGFAAGVVLAVGFVHSIPDAFESWGAFVGEYPWSPVLEYAWPGFIAMFGALLTFIVEEVVFLFLGLSHDDLHDHGDGHGHGGDEDDEEDAHGHGHGHGHGHAHRQQTTQLLIVSEAAAATTSSSTGSSTASSTASGTGEIPLKDMAPAGDLAEPAAAAPVLDAERAGLPVDPTERVKQLTEMWTLWIGLSFHSLFVGVALGVTSTEQSLFSAIVAHQFFEGVALGARVARSRLRKQWHIWLVDIAFAVTAPIGIAIGMGVREAVLVSSAHSQCVYYVLDTVIQGMSGGVLAYVSMVHMMKEEMERMDVRNSKTAKMILFAGFLLGAGALAIIGIWA